jgi:hypothetical protein
MASGRPSWLSPSGVILSVATEWRVVSGVVWRHCVVLSVTEWCVVVRGCCLSSLSGVGWLVVLSVTEWCVVVEWLEVVFLS